LLYLIIPLKFVSQKGIIKSRNYPSKIVPSTFYGFGRPHVEVCTQYEVVRNTLPPRRDVPPVGLRGCYDVMENVGDSFYWKNVGELCLGYSMKRREGDIGIC